MKIFNHKKIISQSMVFIFLIFLSAFAAASNDAGGPPPIPYTPNFNLAPIHTGPDQVKEGGLGVGPFIASAGAAFRQNTYFTGNVFGGTPGAPASTVFFGGTDDQAKLHTVSLVSNGKLAIHEGIVVGGLSSGWTKVEIPICADAQGKMQKCGSSSDQCPSGQMHLPPDNHCGSTVIVACEGYCSYDVDHPTFIVHLNISGIPGYTTSPHPGLHLAFDDVFSITYSTNFSPIAYPVSIIEIVKSGNNSTISYCHILQQESGTLTVRQQNYIQSDIIEVTPEIGGC